MMLRDPVGRLHCRRAGIDVDEMPRAKLAFVAEAGFHFNDRCRAKIGPGKFFFTGPAKADRMIRGLGQAGGFDPGFAGMFTAKTCAEIGDHDANFFVGQMEGPPVSRSKR